MGFPLTIARTTRTSTASSATPFQRCTPPWLCQISNGPRTGWLSTLETLTLDTWDTSSMKFQNPMFGINPLPRTTQDLMKSTTSCSPTSLQCPQLQLRGPQDEALQVLGC